MEMLQDKVRFNNSRNLFYIGMAGAIATAGALIYFSLIKPLPCFTGRYVQVDSMLQLFLLLPAPIATFIIFSLISPPVELYSDRVVKLHWFVKPQTFYLDEMLGWRQSNYKGRDSMSLYFPQGFVSLSNIDINSEAIERISTKYPKYEGSNSLFRNYIFLYMACSFVYIAGFVFLIGYGKRQDWKGTEMYTIHNVVVNRGPAEMMHHNKNSSWRDVRFMIKGQSDYVFILTSESDIKQHMNEWQAHAGRGDTADIQILKYDYEVKIAATREPGFFDKHWDWYKIRALSLGFTDTAPKDSSAK